MVSVSDLMIDGKSNLSSLTTLKITLPDTFCLDALKGLATIVSLQELCLDRWGGRHCETSKRDMKEIESLFSLTSLSLSSISLTHHIAETIARMKLKKLRLYKSSVNLYCLGALCGMEQLSHFEIIYGNLGEEHLAILRLMDQIRILNLFCTITDASLPLYIKSMRNLRTLIVDEWPHEKSDTINIITCGGSFI